MSAPGFGAVFLETSFGVGNCLNSDSICLSHAVNSCSLCSSRVKALLNSGFEMGSVVGAGVGEGRTSSSVGMGKIEEVDGVSFEVLELHHHPIAYYRLDRVLNVLPVRVDVEDDVVNRKVFGQLIELHNN